MYLVQDLQKVVEDGGYKFNPADEIEDGTGGVLADYRAKLIDTKWEKANAWHARS